MTDSSDVIEVEVETNIYRAQFDFETKVPSAAVVDLLQRITERSQTDLKPLYDFVDPENLNEIVAHSNGKRNRCTVTFPYQKLLISVRSTGEITVQPRSDTDQDNECR